MIRIQHAGTEVSFEIYHANDGFTSFKIVLSDQREHTINVGKTSKVDLLCPSVEGTVIWCHLENNQELFFDSITGTRLSEEELREKNPTFYS